MGRQDPKKHAAYRDLRRGEEKISRAELKGRVLGVDLGLARTGLAITDELRITSRALPNLVPKKRVDDIAHLCDLVRDFTIVDIAIGHATLASGDEGMMAKRARAFAAALQNALPDCKVHLVDESGSSAEASARLVAQGVRKSERKASLDGEAARVIIERFLQQAKTPNA